MVGSLLYAEFITPADCSNPGNYAYVYLWIWEGQTSSWRPADVLIADVDFA
jgi:hypothetical protein